LLRVVLERLGKVPQPMMRSAEGAIQPRSSAWKSARRLPPPNLAATEKKKKGAG